MADNARLPDEGIDEFDSLCEDAKKMFKNNHEGTQKKMDDCLEQLAEIGKDYMSLSSMLAEMCM